MADVLPSDGVDEPASAELAQSSSPIQITEGAATVRFAGQSNAFYNPVQEFNRDLT
jgi:hypothetical protein